MRIGRLAERQHGVVSLTQLQFIGLSPSGVRERVAAGRLTRIHRGVYAVGHARLTKRGRWMAAVLAYGPGAVLSHRSAAALHGIRPDNRPKSEVTLPSPSARSRPAIDVHRSTTLTPSDVTEIDGMPCTSLARTLLDLAEVVDRRGVERAVDQAEVRRVFDLRAVHEVLSRATGRRGAGLFAAVLAEYDGPTLTDGELKERFFMLCRDAGIPKPGVNVWIAIGGGINYKADYLWRAQRLAGWEVVRFTWRDVEREPEEVTSTLAKLWRARHQAGLTDAA